MSNSRVRVGYAATYLTHGTRPLRVLTHPAREGANQRDIGNGWFLPLY